ncbi:MAG: hypothetical protein QOF40_516 [Actinomycetota bacterium]|nr:hypothetical protein [Actinomycetota bacterium]
MTMRQLETASRPVDAEMWVTALRDQLIQSGYDRRRVDELIVVTLARFRSARLRDFIPLLVERSVRRALDGDRSSLSPRT